ncbi:MAG TPA: FtsX-like permease family protein [Verrucomicrobiales bacterium]|nr:FtsX-like permease family protein [Verrucomicrobiales bacterium]
MFLVELKESFFLALQAIGARKMRSCLTVLGILVGVFSIIVVMTAVRIMKSSVESSLSDLGVNTFRVNRTPVMMVSKDRSAWQKIWRRRDLNYRLGMQLREKVALPSNVGFEESFRRGSVVSRYAETDSNVELNGVTPGVFDARNWDVEEGRALVEMDLDSARMVCVLGSSLKEKVFPFGSAIGEKVKFKGINYKVVGVLASKGTVMGQDEGNFLLIPLTTGLNRYGYRRSLNYLVQTESQTEFEDAMEETRGILRTLRKVPPGEEDDFEIVSNDSLIAQFNKITLVARSSVAVISSIALIVAGIGIMNIMLVSVTERTAEIGIQRAVGAKKRTILVQFLIEAILLCLLGGIIGIIFGVLGGNIVAMVTNVPPVIPLDWIVIGLVICVLIGIVFGTYPAYKASQLNPIEALHYE